MSAEAEQSPAVTVYTRPGCPYSFLLRRRLRRRGVPFVEVDIWQDPQAAAAVRAVADGNETVPTVHVAGQWLVNPSADAVERLARPGSGR
ncbi:glutaredoxin domain-containing protein [Solwaraspora sp. WMMD1047]|uniref:glutaredoxin family protein n=1 Tax=Solwaraspora sp. WMMD1047 TaxID=3016102 RepID=UPI0024167019|nr:glutaredoxin domain-containing protein [Solwaraspora sp. WMMD1047]MDG4832843.1 glutaredoxin domain-containing protein [Solwaraspora sp. WMMD1047]